MTIAELKRQKRDDILRIASRRGAQDGYRDGRGAARAHPRPGAWRGGAHLKDGALYLVWEIIQNDMLSLKQAIQAMLSQVHGGGPPAP